MAESSRGGCSSGGGTVRQAGMVGGVRVPGGAFRDGSVEMVNYSAFVDRLVRNEMPAASPAELDGLFHWLAGRRNEPAAAVEKAFRNRGVAPDSAQRQVLRYLDRTLFRHNEDYYRLFGLPSDTSLEAIRTRHKQLLQIFHPDRHSTDRDWFTARTEQLNRAYAHLKSNHGRPQPRPDPPGPSRTAAPPPRRRAAPVRRGRGRQRPSMAVFKARLRRRLQAYIGNPVRFERRLYIVLYSVPAILFLVIYLNQMHFAGGAPDGDGDNRKDTDTGAQYRYADDVSTPQRRGGNHGSTPSPVEAPLQQLFRKAEASQLMGLR